MATDKRKLANYYKDLPQGFAEDYRIDAKKTSVGVILNVIALVLMIAVVVICGLIKFRPLSSISEIEMDWTALISLFVLFVAIIVYLIIHELTHGLFYKLLTKQKLRFGLTLTVAYCGLKEGFVNKKTSLIATLAPFVLHGIWMVIAIIFVPVGAWALMLIILFGLHVGGCCGDLWVTCILLFKYAGKPVLVGDDGPCQRFYTYIDQPEASNAEQTEEVNGD